MKNTVSVHGGYKLLKINGLFRAFFSFVGKKLIAFCYFCERLISSPPDLLRKSPPEGVWTLSRPSERLQNTIPLIAMIFLLTSCGGGGGDDSTDVQSSGSVFKSCGMENGPLRIMPIGDSVTEGEKGYNSYRLNLWDKLLFAGCDVDFVGSRRGVSLGFTGSGSTSPPNVNFDQDHQGYWGRRTDEVLAFSEAGIAANKPHIALIHLGTNDAVQGQDAASTLAELSTLIDRFRVHNPDIRIVIAQLIPANRSQGVISQINSGIPGLASSKSTAQSPIVVVNQSSGYSLANNYDGIHPAPSGEEKLAQKWFEGILSINSL